MSPSEVQPQTVKVGDLFRSNDRRDPAPRVIRVIDLHPFNRVWVETVEHWDETRIGKHKMLKRERLERGRNRDNGYTKVSH